MKGQLYAVRVGSKFVWRFTILINTDIQYWFEQYGADAGLLLLEPFISFGQAAELLQMISADPEAASQWPRALPRLTEKLQQMALHCGIPSELFSLQTIHYDMWKRDAFPRLQIDGNMYTRIVKACSGRLLLADELQQLLDHIGVVFAEPASWWSYIQLASLNGDLELTNGLHVARQRNWRRGFRQETAYRCKRCGSGSNRMFWSACIHCGRDCPYCEECLTMGRTRLCSLLVGGRSDAQTMRQWTDTDEYGTYLEPWGLSKAQAAASLEGLRYVAGGEGRNGLHSGPRKFLIWAVTGAGKTEMIFPFVQYAVARGGRVLIATPRRDVVLELKPRIERAFAGCSVVTLYGGSGQRWEQGQITIATTHQLLRFHEAFDLVIIDEIDAFPYHGDPMLAYAAAKAVKPSGGNILLSATPPREVRKLAERGSLPHVRVPVRFHGHPLPVPELLSMSTLRQCVQTRTAPKSLLTRLQASIERGAQVFAFVPNIKLVEPMVELLQDKLKHVDNGNAPCIEGTSSKDDDRSVKVQRFRNRDIRVLVTTTILERGVTVPKSDVFILDADSKLFDEAALVQMAGRAGRSKDDPAGRVYFAAKEITRSQKEAVRQIKQMNRIARKQGYIQGGSK